MDANTRQLVAAANALRGMIQAAQGVLADYLHPDGIHGDEALNQLVYMFDGPEQRAVEALAQQAIADAERRPEFAPDLIVEAVDFSFVWTKKGALPRVTHHREDVALAEAERLARKNPGAKYIVLRAHTKISFNKDAT